MENIVYISDLDGTLLDKEKHIPRQAEVLLNKMIKDTHVHFSIATARTPATVSVLLENVAVNVPVIVMNGAALYDLRKDVYVDVAYILPEARMQLEQATREKLKDGFCYAIRGNELLVYYENLDYTPRLAFFEERQGLKRKRFIKGKAPKDEKVAYFVFLDTKENIEKIVDCIKDIPYIAIIMYKDIYSETGYLLEVYSDQATKANGVRKLRNIGGFDKVVCFGDNLNDLSMFEASDETYAVANAVETVKKQADGVIGSNEEGSVPRFIASHYQQLLDQEVTKC